MDLAYNDSNHTYSINGVFSPGCSTISNMMPKDALVNWASGCAVDFIRDNWDKVMNRDELLRIARTAWKVRRDNAADIGIRVHKYCEMFFKDGSVPPITEVPEVHNSFNLFMKWIIRFEVKLLHSEAIVGCEKLMVGGRIDAIAHVRDHGVCLIDFKSSKGIYDSHYVQAAGYRMLYDSMKMEPKIDNILILHIPKTGNLFNSKVPPYPYEVLQEAFLGCLSLYRGIKKMESIGKSLKSAA